MNIDFSDYELRATDKELGTLSVDGIEVEILAFDEEVTLDSLPADRRLTYLSETTRRVITGLFNSDVDEAQHVAERLVQSFRNPPTWALELHGAHRNGWKRYDARGGRV